MDKKIVTVTTTALISGLILLSASYVGSFQNWVVLNAASANTPLNSGLNPVFGGVGIRAIVSDNKLSSAAFSLPVNTQSQTIDLSTVKNQTSKQQMNGQLKSELSNSQNKNQVIFNNDDGRSYQHHLVQNHFKEDKRIKDSNIQIELASSTKNPPLVVELDKEVLVEFSADYTAQEMQKALSRLLVQPNHLDADDLISSNVINTRLKPYLYGKALNEYKKPVRYPAQAFKYAEYLMLNRSEKVQDEQGEFKVVTIPLTEHQLPKSIKNYQAWVKEYAKKYGVSAELIFAIMHVESAFNPKAVSHSNALGLMQVKANAAGRDVYKYIDQRAGQPTPSELFNPKENIRVGTAYVSLLNHMYLKGIRNADNKELVAISAYNGGLSTVLKLFGKTPEKAIKRINQLQPRQVYRILRYSHQSDETKRYIEKVTQAKNRYKELLNFAA